MKVTVKRYKTIRFVRNSSLLVILKKKSEFFILDQVFNQTGEHYFIKKRLYREQKLPLFAEKYILPTNKNLFIFILISLICTIF